MTISYHLPGNYPVWRYVTTTILIVHVWTKPADIAWVYITGNGAGGSGAGGATGAAGSARNGGGAGGSGATSRLWIPAHLVPRQLFILPGVGGASVAAATGGTTGGNTYVSSDPTTNPAATPGCVYLSATGGTGGLSGGSGGGGGAVSATTGTGSALFSAHGIYVNVAGQNGTAGGANTGAFGVALNYGAPGLPFTGGTGGAGTGTGNANFAGGEITGSGPLVTVPGGLAAGGAGVHGIINEEPPYSLGGTGGGSNGASGVGGRGGDGAPGCGGGGGGAGVTGGASGSGGSGVVWIFVGS